MLHLLQLFKTVQDKDLFINVFSDFKELCEDMEADDFVDGKEVLFSDMLLEHFDLEVLDSSQITRIVNTLVKYDNISFLREVA